MKKILSEECKRKISESKKLNPTRYWLWKHLPKEMAENLRQSNIWRIPWNKWRKETRREVLEKQRLSHIGKKQSKELIAKRIHKGEKSAHWKGWITPINKQIRWSDDFLTWRQSVFMRDKWLCRKCWKGKRLHAHHIKNFSQYPELRFSVDNWITLCKDHHIEFHNKYWRKNNNLQQLEEYLK